MSNELQSICNGLSGEEKERLSDVLAAFDIHEEDALDLLQFKVRLEGQKFHGTVPADFAHALWKLQLSYYRMVALALHGSENATLTPEEKKKHQLVFKIESGSTLSVADLGDSFFDLLEKLVDKMEPVHILALAVILGAAYLGKQWMDNRTEQKKTEAEKSRYEAEIDLVKHSLQIHKDIIQAATDAGRDGRIGLIKGVEDIDRAEIGARVYGQDEILRIKRRSPREKAKSETRILHVTVEDIGTKDKSKPSVVLREKGTEDCIRAWVALSDEEESDEDNALDIIWNAARYPDRYFWVELSVVSRRGKVVEASILNAAVKKEDLLSDDSEDGGDEA